MELQQLKTFVAVAREGSITRASERIHLSQPAVSAQIKALEDALEMALFERTPRGMRLTAEGQRLLLKAEQALDAHQALLDEARRMKGHRREMFRLGVVDGTSKQVIGRLLERLSDRGPDVEVVLVHGASQEVIAGIQAGDLDAGLYNEAGRPQDPALTTIEVARFGVYLAAPAGLAAASGPLDWQALAEVPWIYPGESASCGAAAERLFTQHGIRPRRVLRVDREDLTRTLIAGGVGVGLLHEELAIEAQRRGEVELVCESRTRVRVVFGYLASRAHDVHLAAASTIMTNASA